MCLNKLILLANVILFAENASSLRCLVSPLSPLFFLRSKKTELERSCVLIREKMKTVNPRLNQLAETNGIGLGFSRLYFPSCFFFFFSTSTVEKRGRKLDTSNAIFFIDLPPIHPFFIARSADRCSKRPTWFHVENYSNRVRIFSFSPRSYLHIFFSVWKCWKTFLDRDNPF